MKPKKISNDDLESLITGVKSQSIEVVGNYLYKGFRIQVSKYNLSGAERVQLLYQKRRNNGLCIVCGNKVTKKNLLPENSTDFANTIARQSIRKSNQPFRKTCR